MLEALKDNLEQISGGIIMAKDPICGMEVDETKATAKAEHLGKTYYLCSTGCKQAFEGNLEKYASVRAEGSQRERR